MEQTTTITTYQLFLIGLGIGFVLGLIPLLVGIFKKNTKLGIIGFISTFIGGAIWSVLALLVAIVFTVLLFIKSKSSLNESESIEKTDLSEVS